MNTNLSSAISQTAPIVGVLYHQSNLSNFFNDETITQFPYSYSTGSITYKGHLLEQDNDRHCPSCGHTHAHIKETRVKKLKHFPMGNGKTELHIEIRQYRCPNCTHTFTQQIPFQSRRHNITEALEVFIKILLARGTMTLKEISRLCHVGKNIIRDIDKRRLEREHLDENGFIKLPETAPAYLGIDEFSLHKGHQYATHIIDLETGRVLWIERGKDKSIVERFLDHAGDEWVKGIKAVAADMNAGFAAAFKERCPHIDIVNDHFHIVKTFNDKVADEVRKDIYRKKKDEGSDIAAKPVKSNKYVWLVNVQKLKEKIEKSKESGRSSHHRERYERQLETYEQLMEQYSVFGVLQGIKEKLNRLYTLSGYEEMESGLNELIYICNPLLKPGIITQEEREAAKEIPNQIKWFGKFLNRHREGILSHAKHPISNGKIEGLNNKIKTIRRMGYGLPDDHYFFLRVVDASIDELSIEERSPQ